MTEMNRTKLKPEMSKKFVVLIPVLAVFLLIGVGFAAYYLYARSTLHNIAVSQDSTYYLSGAQNLIAGKGFISYEGKAITHFPPFYSLVLSLFGRFNSNILIAARTLNLVLFLLNIYSVGLLVYFLCRRSLWAGFFAMLYYLACGTILQIHIFAWSEPLYILLMTTSLALLGLYFFRKRRIFLFFSAFWLGLALITRFVGAAMIPVAIVAIFFSTAAPRNKKIWDILAYCGIALLPLLILLANNVLIYGNATNRSLAFHPVSVAALKLLVSSLYDLWFHYPLTLLAKAVIDVLFYGAPIILFFAIFKREWKKDAERQPLLLLLATLLGLAGGYLLFLIFSISFIDVATAFDTRILSPLVGICLIFIFVFLFNYFDLIGNGIVKGIAKALQFLKGHIYVVQFLVILILFILGLVMLKPVLKDAVDYGNSGQGYTDAKWMQSETIAYLKTLPDNLKIYSNNPGGVYTLTGSSVSLLPQKYSPTSLIANPTYQKELDSLCEDLDLKRIIVVYFKTDSPRSYVLSENEFRQQCNPAEVFQLHDGNIYGLTNR